MADQDKRPDQSGSSESQAEIMKKALRLKQEAGPEAEIPAHRTANEGSITGEQMGSTDTRLTKEGTWTENVGRSHGARVGDAGKTTGPGRR